MRDRVGKRVQLLIGGAQLRSASGHAVFEVGVELQDGFLRGFSLADVPAHRDPVRGPPNVVEDGHDVHLDPQRLAVFGVADHFRAHRLQPTHVGRHPLHLGHAGLRALKKRRWVAQHVFQPVATYLFKRCVDEHNSRHFAGDLGQVGDDDDVVQPRHSGFQQPQLFKGPMFAGDVLKIHRQSVLGGVGIDLVPGVKRRVEILEALGQAVLHDLTVFLIQRRANGARKCLPQTAAKQAVAVAVQHAGGLGVHK